MNILYITHCDPRRTDFGSAQRTHWLWKSLQSIGMVYAVYNVGPCESLSKDDELRIASWHLSPSSWLLRHLHAWFAKAASPAAWCFRSKRFVLDQMPWKGVQFDAVVVRYLNMVAYSNAWQFGPVYVDVDDLPIEAYETIHSKNHRWLMSRIWHCVVSYWQRSMLEHCKAAWIANASQVEQVSGIVPCKVLPNLATPPKPTYQINGRQKQQLMTVGLMSYEPNYQGVDWFVTSIWPDVKAAFPEMTYMIAGGGCPESYRKKWAEIPGVQVLGFVEDLDALYETSLAVVTPILSGSGTCIKVLEAALRGRKVFATEFALRGYDDTMRDGLRFEEIDLTERMMASLQMVSEKAQNDIISAAQRVCSYNSFEKLVIGLMSREGI